MTPTDGTDQHVLGPGMAATPFTADEIRRACPTGRTVLLTVTDAEGTVRHRMSRFVACDDEGANFERGACTPEGEPIGVLEGTRVSWLDLQGHASFRASAVTIEADTVDLPVGHLECLRYTLTEGDDVTTFWFATSMPGMPVRVVSATAGRMEETTEIVANLLP